MVERGVNEYGERIRCGYGERRREGYGEREGEMNMEREGEMNMERGEHREGERYLVVVIGGHTRSTLYTLYVFEPIGNRIISFFG